MMEAGLLRSLHEHELIILDELSRICDQYGLSYYLIGGTLLGAVRHNGFIPWDDDIDIGMPRCDYDKLRELAARELSDRFFYQSIETDHNWKRDYAKIRMNNTLFIEKKGRHMKYHQGIFIDIFPMDTGKRPTGLSGTIRQAYVKIVNHHIYMLNGEFQMNLKHRLLGLVVPDKMFYRLRSHWKKGKGDSYIIYSGMYGIKTDVLYISDCNPPVLLEFEGKTYPAPRMHKQWLSRLYGNDYMELPPQEKRVTHNPVQLSFDTLNGEEELY